MSIGAAKEDQLVFFESEENATPSSTIKHMPAMLPLPLIITRSTLSVIKFGKHFVGFDWHPIFIGESRGDNQGVANDLTAMARTAFPYMGQVMPSIFSQVQFPNLIAHGVILVPDAPGQEYALIVVS